MSPEKQARIVQVARDNDWQLTTAQLAERFGVSSSTVIHVLRRAGVAPQHILGRDPITTEAWHRSVEQAMRRLALPGDGWGCRIVCSADVAVTAKPRGR